VNSAVIRSCRVLLRLATASAAATSVAVVPGTALAPAAHADTVRTATASAYGGTAAIGAANAESEARRNLAIQAIGAAEVCRSVTSSSEQTYRSPDGSTFVYSATATGTCGLVPPYSSLRTATSVGAASTLDAASSNAVAAATALVSAPGGSCAYWVYSATVTYVAPTRTWYNVQATARALCTG
jgi:hypothetical protein